MISSNFIKKKKKISQKSVWSNFIKKINLSKIDLGKLYKKKKKTLNKSKKTSKTPLGETGCLGNPYFTGCLSIQFFNSPLPLTQSVRPPMATYPSLCSTCVTYGTLCHARGHSHSYLGKRRISPGVISILSMYLRLHT